MSRIIIILITATCYQIAVAQSVVNSQSADSTIIRNLVKQVEDLQKQSQVNSSNINSLLTGIDLDASNKYSIIKQNLVNAVMTFQLLNNKINILKSKASSDKLDVFIKDLNNPQSNTLGFKLDETIIRLVNENIQPKKKNLAQKIIETATSITKSPIVTNIPAISPAISVANSFLTVLRSTSIMNDQIDETKIKAFETALNNYIQYYVALNEGNTSFNFNIINQIQDLGLLQQKLYEQVTFFAKTLGYSLPTKGQNEDLGTYLNSFFSGFSKAFIDRIFIDLEQANTISVGKLNYEAILTSNNGNLKEANNRLEEFISLINQFEFLYNSYFNIYELYNSKTISALDIAANNRIAEPALVNSKKIEFTELKTQAVNDIKSSINLQELLSTKQLIKYTARII